MLKKLLDIYKIYFAISVFVAILLILTNIGTNPINYVLIVFGALLTPFLYELDFILYAYILDVDSIVSKNIRNFIANKNLKSAFLYAHEHTSSLENDVLRSILMVIGVFCLGFLLTFGLSNVFALSICLSYLLTSLYLQTVSFTDNSWRTWYSFTDFIPKEKFAKTFLLAQYVIYIIFIFTLF